MARLSGLPPVIDLISHRPGGIGRAYVAACRIVPNHSGSAIEESSCELRFMPKRRRNESE